MFVKASSLIKIVGLAAGLAMAASCVRYHPEPVVPAKAVEDFEARRLDAPELKDFLLQNQDIKDWPPAAWDLKALTLAALYYHPDMDIARAEWGVARAGRITAGERPNPTLNPLMGYNSTTPRSEITPWIPEINLEIPIETAGKRGFRVDEARHLSEAARWNILSAAWEVRSRLRGALLDVYAAGEKASLLRDQERLQAETVRIIEAQKEAGEVSTYDLTQARVALDNGRLAAIEADRVKEDALARLAAALGLPRRALDGVNLSFDGFRRPEPDIPAGEVRLHAVLNRSDILAFLSEYAASESALRLEIAKQYPPRPELPARPDGQQMDPRPGPRTPHPQPQPRSHRGGRSEARGERRALPGHPVPGHQRARCRRRGLSFGPPEIQGGQRSSGQPGRAGTGGQGQARARGDLEARAPGH